jgi:hypothetical protein
MCEKYQVEFEGMTVFVIVPDEDEQPSGKWAGGQNGPVLPRGWTMTTTFDIKSAITEDVKELDLALSVLNSLRDTNLARLALLREANNRSEKKWG